MIFGPETWKEIDGVTFLYWDRWFLRLAMDERAGLDGLLERFESDRKRMHRYQREDAEAKLSHLDDLKRRLEQLGVAPRDVLGEADTGDKKLLAKSRTKLFDQSLTRKSPAMIDTPRRRLEARSLRGQWDAFAVSPARFEAELWKGRDRHAYYDWRLTMPDPSRDFLERRRSRDDTLLLHAARCLISLQHRDLLGGELDRRQRVGRRSREVRRHSRPRRRS